MPRAWAVFDVAPVLAELPLDELELEGAHGATLRLGEREGRVVVLELLGRRGLSHLGRQVVEIEPRPRREHDRALERVPELAHVARPGIGGEGLESLGRDLARAAPVLAREVGEDALDDEPDVVPARSQGRQEISTTFRR